MEHKIGQVGTTEKTSTRYIVQEKIDDENYSLDGIFAYLRKFKNYAKARKFLMKKEAKAVEKNLGNYSYRMVEQTKLITKTTKYREVNVDYTRNISELVSV